VGTGKKFSSFSSPSSSESERRSDGAKIWAIDELDAAGSFGGLAPGVGCLTPRVRPGICETIFEINKYLFLHGL
jgi:hypothetical protein